MTFEEKLAARGRKMDEMKAKLDDAISERKKIRQETKEELAAEVARLDAAFDEFDAAVDAQIEKQWDAYDAQVQKQVNKIDAQVEKQAEKIDAQIDKQIDTMDERINEAADIISDSMDRAEEKIENGAAKVKSAFTLDKATAEAVANEPTKIDEIEKGTAEQVARAKGDIAAAEENVRLIREQRENKWDSVKLRTQMKVNNAKEKIAEHKEAVDKAAQEEWILDLLDYAEGCYETAYSWALEAEYTLMEAAYEIDYYNERFGTKE